MTGDLISEAVKGGSLLFRTEYARSGMTRWTRVYGIIDKLITEITWPVAKKMNYTFRDSPKRYGIEFHGCGFSARYEIIGDLSRDYPGIKDCHSLGD